MNAKTSVFVTFAEEMIFFYYIICMTVPNDTNEYLKILMSI